jgi:hypothetical protein
VSAGAAPAWHPRRLLAGLALLFVVIAGSAMLRNSATWDEIVFMSVGARGMHTGDFDIVNDHPRLAQYLYGVPAWLAARRYPPEDGRWSSVSRYYYSRAFLWGVGNEPERIIMSARLVGLAFGVLTVLGVFFLSRRHLGDGWALFAAALTAFMPDMLAHSGVAYNDVPLAFGYLAGVYALDAAVRDPSARRVALAALAFALTMCIKYSGLILGPVLLALLAMEAAAGRWRDRAWLRRVEIAVPIFAAIVFVVIEVLYAGAWPPLGRYISGLQEVQYLSEQGRPAFLLGESRRGGWWYFFPVAFALKTPLGLHLLMVAAIAGAVIAARRGRVAWLSHPARAAAVGAAMFVAVAFLSGFNIGTRHVLPIIPLACILVAQGVAAAWEAGKRAVHVAIALSFAAFAISSLSAYPYFLSYLSEYAWGRGPARTLVDSNTDWGQGLLALRDFMREHRQERVALAYFGSALPEGYGIRYLPLTSFLSLPKQPEPARFPRYIVVSATLLTGNYLTGDPYAKLRLAKPVAILGGSLYVYDGGAR